MRITIIGTGDLGRTLAYRLSALGHDVALADFREPEEFADVAAAAHAHATDIADAVRDAELVILAIPFRRYAELPPRLFDGKIVVDATDYYAPSDGPIAEIDEGKSASSELIARHLSGARVVKAFNTPSFRTIGEVGRLAGDVARVGIPIAGDDEAAKAIVADLIADLGFDPVDAGSLADSKLIQPGTIAYATAGTADELVDWLTSA